jgi:ribosomal protein S18 acetylase RimI-like enzyme
MKLDRKMRFGPELSRPTVEKITNVSDETFDEIWKFYGSLRQRYSNRFFPVYSELQEDEEKRSNVALIGRVEGNVAGVSLGRSEGKVLELQLLLTDPRYQNSGIADALMQKLQEGDYSVIKGIAEVFGEVRGANQKIRSARDNALVEFYSKHDFIYDPSRRVWRGLPMIWTKKETV